MNNILHAVLFLLVVFYPNVTYSKDIIHEVCMIEINTYGKNQQRQLLIWDLSSKIIEYTTLDNSRYRTVLGVGVQHVEIEDIFGPNRLKLKRRGDYWYWQYRPGVLFRTKNYIESKTLIDRDLKDRLRLPEYDRNFRKYFYPEVT